MRRFGERRGCFDSLLVLCSPHSYVPLKEDYRCFGSAESGSKQRSEV